MIHYFARLRKLVALVTMVIAVHGDAGVLGAA
jgi:hypothetical protein